MREGCVLVLFREFRKASCVFLLLGDDAQPAKPLRFIRSGPQRRIARPQPANLSVRGPSVENRAGSVLQLAGQRKLLWIDSGSHNQARFTETRMPKRQSRNS